jgi:hypothetical protein
MSDNEGTAIVPLGGDVDDLMQIAAHAEKRIDAVMKIKRVALKVTNAMDWVDQKDKPYLMASGSEKIANLFGISWRLLSPEPAMELESDGNFTYTYTGEFSMGNRSVQCEGSRSSRDKFFVQYDYSEDRKSKKERLVSDRDNKRDVKMAAFTNLLGNGITRLLGIRNMTYADLLEFAGIKKDDLQKVVYKDNKKADPPATPTKAEAQPSAPVKHETPKPKPGETEPPDEAGTPVEDVFAKLEKALANFCDGNEDAMQEKLQALTSFPGKDKETGKPTGKIVPGVKYVSDLRMKNSEVRARIALDKLTDEMNGER